MPRHPSTANRGALSPADRRRRLLILGRVQDIPEILAETIGASSVLASFADLDAALLARLEPDAVLAPVIGGGPDLPDIAARLLELGYRGVLRCYVRPMPRQAEIADDLAVAFPGLVVEFVAVRR